MRNEKKSVNLFFIAALAIFVIAIMLLIRVGAVDPGGPDSVVLLENETKNTTAMQTINISGGRIATLDLNATIQNPRWKAFVGNVTGKFTLMDSAAAVVFDWTITSITGRIYATANSSALSWSVVNCSNVTSLESENAKFNHTRADDNITKTFNATFNSSDNRTLSGSHNPFYAAGRYIPASTCPTLNTYKNSASQDTDFEEVALYDNSNMIYATLLEENVAGYNNENYDFQMIVPEIGLADFSGATAYYLYVEIGV
jgi:hypothetical protein